LRVKPALVYALAQRREKTSWRGYGGLHSKEDVDQEAARITQELKELAAKADFGLDVQPVSLVGSDAEVAAAAAAECDVILVYASGGSQAWLENLAACGKPNVMFLRHKSGPFYLWYEIAHWRLLRKSEDAFTEPNMDVDDIVVDDYGDVLWRLRALYGLVNTKGTKIAAIGGHQAYSTPGNQLGPTHARDVWGMEIIEVPIDQVAQRMQHDRGDAGVMSQIEKQAETLLAQPGVTLETDRRFIVNSFLVLRVFREILRETGATNLGVANCMGSLIGVLDTTPCLVLSLLNDQGYTAFCHVDLTHTPPGVLLRWISGKPSFVCNSHFPHHGLMTLAHCAAPRRMDGKQDEPTKIMTHFESDYGAATKVEYRQGQITTNIVPNLHCSKWFGYRAKILDSPAFDACRSQMDVQIDGDWRRLLKEMEGFHTQVCYGDYLREIGYALKKVGIPWVCVSECET
jgi:L-fucose isomerase-like protein